MAIWTRTPLLAIGLLSVSFAARAETELALKPLNCVPSALCATGGPAGVIEDQLIIELNRLRFSVLGKSQLEKLLKQAGFKRDEVDVVCYGDSCVEQLMDILGAYDINHLLLGKLVVDDSGPRLFLKLQSAAAGKIVGSGSVRARSIRQLEAKLGGLVKTVLAPLTSVAPDPQLATPASGPVVEGGQVAAELGWISLTTKGQKVTVTLKGPRGSRQRFILPPGRPWTKQVPPGNYDWVASAPGFANALGKLQVAVDMTAAANIRLLRPGSLTIDGSPPGAKVVVTGPQNLKVTKGLPIKMRQMPSGSYRLHVSRKGYQSVTRNVTLRAGRHQNVKIHLKRVTVTPARRSVARPQARSKPRKSYRTPTVRHRPKKFKMTMGKAMTFTWGGISAAAGILAFASGDPGAGGILFGVGGVLGIIGLLL